MQFRGGVLTGALVTDTVKVGGLAVNVSILQGTDSTLEAPLTIQSDGVFGLNLTSKRTFLASLPTESQVVTFDLTSTPGLMSFSVCPDPSAAVSKPVDNLFWGVRIHRLGFSTLYFYDHTDVSLDPGELITSLPTDKYTYLKTKFLIGSCFETAGNHSFSCYCNGGPPSGNSQAGLPPVSILVGSNKFELQPKDYLLPSYIDPVMVT